MSGDTSNTAGLSRYLNTLVPGKLVPAKVAAVLNRLPNEKLQAQTLAHMREGLLPLAEQTVSDMLNPPSERPTPALAGAPEPTYPQNMSTSALAPPHKPSLRVRMTRLAISLAIMFFVGRNGYRHASRWIHEWKMPVPQITQAYMTPEGRLFLRWNPVGREYAYRLYYAYGGEDPVPLLDGGSRLLTSAALINVPAQGNKEAYITSPQSQCPALSGEKVGRLARYACRSTNTIRRSMYEESPDPRDSSGKTKLGKVV